MDENKTTVPPTTEAAPVVLTQAELDAKAAKEKADADAAAAEQYVVNRKVAELACMTSQADYNNAATWACYGIAIGATLAGAGILLHALRK